MNLEKITQGECDDWMRHQKQQQQQQLNHWKTERSTTQSWAKRWIFSSQTCTWWIKLSSTEERQNEHVVSCNSRKRTVLKHDKLKPVQTIKTQYWNGKKKKHWAIWKQNLFTLFFVCVFSWLLRWVWDNLSLVFNCAITEWGRGPLKL